MWKLGLLLLGALCVTAQRPLKRIDPATLVHNDKLIKGIARPFVVRRWNESNPDHALDYFTSLLNFTDNVLNQTFSRRIFSGRVSNNRQLNKRINIWLKNVRVQWRTYQGSVHSHVGCVSLAEKKRLLCNITSRFSQNPFLDNLYGWWLEYQPEDGRLDSLIECCSSDSHRLRNACFRQVDQSSLEYYCDINSASAEWEDCCSYSSKTCKSKCLEWYRRRQNKCDPKSEMIDEEESSSESESEDFSRQSRSKESGNRHRHGSKESSKKHSHRKSSERSGSKEKGRGKGKKHGKGKKGKGQSGHQHSSQRSSENSSKRQSSESSRSEESSSEESIMQWIPTSRCQWSDPWGSSSGYHGVSVGWRGKSRPIWKVDRGSHSGGSSEGRNHKDQWKGDNWWKNWKASQSTDANLEWDLSDDDATKLIRLFGSESDLLKIIDQFLSGSSGSTDSSDMVSSAKDPDEFDWSEESWGEDSDESEESWEEWYEGMTTPDSLEPFYPEDMGMACCQAGLSMASMMQIGSNGCELGLNAFLNVGGHMFPPVCQKKMIACCRNPELIDWKDNWAVMTKEITTPAAHEVPELPDGNMPPDSTYQIPRRSRG